MRDSLTHLRFGPWLLLIGAAVISLGLSETAWAQDSQKKVLVLYSTGRDAAISLSSERELPRILDRGLAGRLDYYSEYIDGGRFSDPQYQVAFRDLLRLKYGGQRFEVVIAILEVAVAFLDRSRYDLFPGTPVVFLALNPVARRIANATGAIAQVDFGQTLTLAMALQPDVNHVFVVSGAGSRDRALENVARAQLRIFEPRLTFTYLSGLPTSELEQRLAALPTRSIVYFMLVYQDGSGENFQPLDYLDRIAPVANRPIYSWVDSTLGHGVVGGSMQRLDAQLDAVAELALRVLRGERADSIPTSTLQLNINHLDWRELRRWGIVTRASRGTRVNFESSVWERYRSTFLGAVVILLAQTALIAGLMVQGRDGDEPRNKLPEVRPSCRRAPNGSGPGRAPVERTGSGALTRARAARRPSASRLPSCRWISRCSVGLAKVRTAIPRTSRERP